VEGDWSVFTVQSKTKGPGVSMLPGKETNAGSAKMGEEESETRQE